MSKCVQALHAHCATWLLTSVHAGQQSLLRESGTTCAACSYKTTQKTSWTRNSKTQKECQAAALGHHAGVAMLLAALLLAAGL